MKIRKTIWIVLLSSILLPFQLYATTYYVSSASGSDSNSGKYATAPWKSLNKVKQESYRFVPGDVIAFKGGEEFFGSLSLSKLSGTNAAPITITSYGTGKAIITGSKPVSNWTPYSGNVWVSSVAEEVYQLFRADSVLTNARIPNLKGKYAANENFFKISSVVNSSRIFRSEGLIGAKDLIGAKLQVSTELWTISTATVTGFNSSTGEVTIGSNISGGFSTGDNVFINNHYNLLDAEGEWYYDKALQKLFVYSSEKPSEMYAGIIRANGLTINGGSNVIIERLRITHFGKMGIFSSGINDLIIRNNEILHCYEIGVQTQDAERALIESNLIEGSIHNGVKNYNKNSTISKNTISEIGLSKGINQYGFKSGVGIYSLGVDALISENTISDTGYNGIYFAGSNTVIEKNYLKYFHLTSSDGGGIYSYKGKAATLSNNIIIGYPWEESVTFSNRRLTQGIYLDNYTQGVVAKNNTIQNTEIGIALTHSTRNNVVKDNVIYNPQFAGAWLTEFNASNNSFQGNNILTRSELVVPLISQLVSQPSYDWFSLKSNNYFSANGFAVVKEEWNGKAYDLASWQTASGQEEGSKSNDFLLRNFEIIEVLDSNLISNENFSNGRSSWTTWASTATIIEETSGEGNKFLYDTLSIGRKQGSVSTKTKAVEKGYDYVLEFDLKSNITARCIVNIRFSNGEYLYKKHQIYVKSDWYKYEIPIYNLPKDDVSLSVEFFLDSNKQYTSAISLDNVKLKKGKLSEDLTRKEFLAYNTGNAKKNISLSGTWKDLSGTVYENTITLDPYSSKILVYNASGIDRGETPPVVKEPEEEEEDEKEGEDVPTTNFLGNAEVYEQSALSATLRAIPVNSTKEQMIESISIYHNGGRGNMLVGVYKDDNGKPGLKVGSSEETAVNAEQGWQTLDLKDYVDVSAGEKLWLAWTFEDHVYIRFKEGTPGRAFSTQTWKAGLPESFGSSEVFDYTYSVYCKVHAKSAPSEGTLGNVEVFDESALSATLRAIPVSSTKEQMIESISIYHNGGSGNMLVGVYKDDNGKPGLKVASSEETAVNAEQGWQRVDLISDVDVLAGEKLWLAWTFQNHVYIRFKEGTPGRAFTSQGWGVGLPESFGSSDIFDYTYSVYCHVSSSHSSFESTLGNADIFDESALSATLRAIPVSSSHDGIIQSIAIYHDGGKGNMLVGVYKDDNGKPGLKVASSEETAVNADEGWQTLDLISDVDVLAGEQLWLAWTFEDYVYIRFKEGTPGRAYTYKGWDVGLPESFGSSDIFDYTYSVYCNVSLTHSSFERTLGNEDVFDESALSATLRAIPVSSSMDGVMQSISIYHDGGKGNMLVGVYKDDNGKPGLKVASSEETAVNADEGWQHIDLISDVDVQAGEKVWLAWTFQNHVYIRFKEGTPGRAYTYQGWDVGLPESFGSSDIFDYTYSVYGTIRSTGPLTERTRGNVDVFDESALSATLRAIPISNSRAGRLQSISIFHDGGNGNMLVGVYKDDNGKPGQKVASSEMTAVNPEEGWQTIELISKVDMLPDETVWLAWTFQNHVYARYKEGSPARAYTFQGWDAGLPVQFGSSELFDYTYSVYGTIVEPAVTSEKSASMGTFDEELQAKEIGFVEEKVLENVTIYPNPTRGVLNVTWLGTYEKGLRLELYDIQGRQVQQADLFDGSFNHMLDLGAQESGTYILMLRNKEDGSLIKQERVIKL